MYSIVRYNHFLQKTPLSPSISKEGDIITEKVKISSYSNSQCLGSLTTTCKNRLEEYIIQQAQNSESNFHNIWVLNLN
jgi:hypothetical protein